METKLIDGKLYSDLLEGAVINLHNNIAVVNNLNVFPIPDGDTGDNMWLTINGGYKATKELNSTHIGNMAKEAASMMVMKARGNSGAILSRFFAGISNGLLDKEVATPHDFVVALNEGVKEAYKAVPKPTEGTILTVTREASEYLNSKYNDNMSFEQLFDLYLYELKESLNRTPELLAVLKEAGVVDSGGAGLVYIFDGMLSTLKGEPIESTNNYSPLSNNFSSNELDYSKFDENSELTFGYCTEFLLRLQAKKVDVKSFSEQVIIDFLNTVGDSVVCFKTDSIIKAHVHTFHPGVVFNEVQKYGEFLTVKVENMNIQHENTVIENLYSSNSSKKKKYGIVTVATGDGIINTFKELGVDSVIYGGQSMNPSTEDFVDAFNSINADTIFVLPNNSNVILTAQLAAKVYTKADVRVIETKNIGEGYAAVSMFDFDCENVDDAESMLNEAFEGIVTGMVSPCVRDSNINGVETHNGDYIGFINKKIFTNKSTSVDTLIDLADKLNAKDYSVIIVFYGNSENEDDINKLNDTLKSTYKYNDVYLIDGGQDIYNYILILE